MLWPHTPREDPPTASARSSLFAAAAVILTALAFEHFGGYVACPLCLQQRYAYYAGVPALFLALVLLSAGRTSAGGRRLPRWSRWPFSPMPGSAPTTPAWSGNSGRAPTPAAAPQPAQHRRRRPPQGPCDDARDPLRRGPLAFPRALLRRLERGRLPAAGRRSRVLRHQGPARLRPGWPGKNAVLPRPACIYSAPPDCAEREEQHAADKRREGCV